MLLLLVRSMTLWHVQVHATLDTGCVPQIPNDGQGRKEFLTLYRNYYNKLVQGEFQLLQPRRSGRVLQRGGP